MKHEIHDLSDGTILYKNNKTGYEARVSKKLSTQEVEYGKTLEGDARKALEGSK